MITRKDYTDYKKRLHRLKKLLHRWVIICSLSFSLLSLTEPVYSAWWDNLSIPLPHSTREYHQQTMDIGGQDLKLTLYVSSLSKKEIRDFYQNRLPNYGWQLKDLSKEIEDLPENTKPAVSRLGNILKETLYFTKDNLMLNINFLPQRQNDNQTYFSITFGQIKEDGDEQQTIFKPEALSSISVYPGAKQTVSSNSKIGQTYGYVTNDSIEEVSAFYKSDMPTRFNWSLADEQPVKKSNYDLWGGLKQNCPSCSKLPEEIHKASGQTEMYFAALKFKRGEETCLIGITQDKISGQMDSEINQTRITIVYNSK